MRRRAKIRNASYIYVGALRKNHCNSGPRCPIPTIVYPGVSSSARVPRDVGIHGTLLPRPQTMFALPQRPRGVLNDLHNAACCGSAQRTLAVLSRGTIDIDQGDHEGVTPLMYASIRGHARVVNILLNRGADVSLAADDSFTALLASAHAGHHAATKMLLNAGADVQVTTSAGDTPLHLAACRGHSEVRCG